MDEKILNEGIQEQLIETPSFLSMRSSDPNAGIATAACDPYCMAGCESGSSCENYCETVDEDGGCTFCESYCELYGGQCSSCESYCQDSCERNCQDPCESCEDSCMLGTSCEYCEGGECGDCESNYECWCESNCEYCQSTCELTVQDACGINVQTTNAIDWTYCDAADDIEFKQVCYGNGKYIALGRDVNDYSYIFSSTDGINWSILTTMGDMWTNISEICFGNGKFVAIKSYSDREDSIIYSSDGQTWYTASIDFQTIYGAKDLCYSGGMFYVTGHIFRYSNETSYAGTISSSDGINWSDGALVSTNYTYNTCCCVNNNGEVLVVGRSDDGQIITTLGSGFDTFDYGSLGIYKNPKKVQFCNNKYVLLVENSSDIYYSSDGVNWTSLSLAKIDANYTTDIDLFTANSKFILRIKNSSGKQVYYISSNGAIWNKDEIYNYFANNNYKLHDVDYTSQGGYIAAANYQPYIYYTGNNTESSGKDIYVGVNTEIPIYNGTEDIITTINASNINNYFIVQNNSYYFDWVNTSLVSNNKSKHSTTAQTTLIAKRAIKNLSFSWAVSSQTNYDKLTIKKGTTVLVNAQSGTKSGNVSETCPIGTTFIFQYSKNASSNSGSDCGTISNIKVTTEEPKQVGSEYKEVARRAKAIYVSAPTEVQVQTGTTQGYVEKKTQPTQDQYILDSYGFDFQFSYADQISINQSTGEITLINPVKNQWFYSYVYGDISGLANKYISITGDSYGTDYSNDPIFSCWYFGSNINYYLSYEGEDWSEDCYEWISYGTYYLDSNTYKIVKGSYEQVPTYTTQIQDLARKALKIYIGDSSGKARLCYIDANLPTLSGMKLIRGDKPIALVEDWDQVHVTTATQATISNNVITLPYDYQVVSAGCCYDGGNIAYNDNNYETTIKANEFLNKFVDSKYGLDGATGVDSSDIYDAGYCGIIYIANNATFSEADTTGGDIALICTDGWYRVETISEDEDTLPTFYFDGDMSSAYEFEEDMTWEQWVNSSYNLDEWSIEYLEEWSCVVDGNHSYVYDSSGNLIYASDIVRAGTYHNEWTLP